MRPPQSEVERDAMVKAHFSALQIVSAHLLVAKKGLMTYCTFFPYFRRAKNMADDT
jgi:hypothetical protein